MARFVVALLLLVTANAWSDAPTSKTNPEYTDVFVTALIGATYLISLLGIFKLWRLLNRDGSWSWGKALSDEAIVSKPPPQPTSTILTNPDGTTSQTTSFEPSEYSELTSSTSRVIAVFGMVVVLFMFLGFGSVTMWRYAYFGEAKNAMDMMKILFGGVALFVPYGLNQFQKAISAFGSSKK
ncbi:hypothetical protein [Burkholderia pseudomallei]|uniref:hypothetical protein n=1 Tax=Burkholderia pseudomallei TaxID=28450 RepID=UPI0031402D24